MRKKMSSGVLGGGLQSSLASLLTLKWLPIAICLGLGIRICPWPRSIPFSELWVFLSLILDNNSPTYHKQFVSFICKTPVIFSSISFCLKVLGLKVGLMQLPSHLQYLENIFCSPSNLWWESRGETKKQGVGQDQDSGTGLCIYLGLWLIAALRSIFCRGKNYFKKCSDYVKPAGKARARFESGSTLFPVRLCSLCCLSWPISACASLLPGSEAFCSDPPILRERSKVTMN